MRSLFLFTAAAALYLMPLLSRDPFLLNILTLAHLQALFVLGWDLTAGIGGQLSGGHALAFGGAGYLMALLTLKGLPPLAALPVALAGALLLGLLVGLATSRLTGAFVTLVSLALAEIAHEAALCTGITTPAGYSLGGEGGFPVAALVAREAGCFYTFNYYLSLTLLLAAAAGLLALKKSVPGLKLLAVGQDEMAAQAVGLSPPALKTLAFGLGFLLGGTAGALHAQYLGLAAPSSLSLELSFAALVLAILGGKGTVAGPALAAYLVSAFFPGCGCRRWRAC